MYPIEELLFLAISALVCGINDWQKTVIFGDQKLEWLRKYFPYKNGICSPDTFERLFSAIDVTQFEECFRNWVNDISKLSQGEVIAIDGKTMRGSYDIAKGTNAQHIVSAYATQAHLSLGQEVVNQKSNEITAIPELLNLLSINGCVVTIDAMGCQHKIATKILDKNADYILAAKLNQKDLHEQIEKVFGLTRIADTDTNIDTGHGRVETRKCCVINDLTFLDGKEKWDGIKSIVKIETERYNKTTQLTNKEMRYYISSLNDSASIFNQNIRSHWAIENNLHWMLDVSFGEDQSRRRLKNHAVNYNIMAKTALGLLKNSPQKIPISHKKQKAILNDDFRAKILGV